MRKVTKTFNKKMDIVGLTSRGNLSDIVFCVKNP